MSRPMRMLFRRDARDTPREYFVRDPRTAEYLEVLLHSAGLTVWPAGEHDTGNPFPATSPAAREGAGT